MYSSNLPNAPRGPVLRPGKQTTMVMAAMAGVTLLLSGGLYFWQTEEIKKIEKDVADQHDQVEHGERTAKQLGTVQSESALIAGKLQNLEKNVTSGQYIPTLAPQIEKLAKSNGLQIDVFRPTWKPAAIAKPADKDSKEKAPPPPPYDEVKIEMNARGSYKNIARFVHSLTHFQKIIAVDSVNQTMQQSAASGAGIAGVAPTLSVKITMTGYAFKDEASSQAANSSNVTSGGSASQSRGNQREVMNSIK
jgi:Tfp pilus assembly protein PilO